MKKILMCVIVTVMLVLCIGCSITIIEEEL